MFNVLKVAGPNFLGDFWFLIEDGANSPELTDSLKNAGWKTIFLSQNGPFSGDIRSYVSCCSLVN